ncbi:MAG: 2-oxoacid:acceptor oxidoreductase family protein [Deltaproteobacteria bacterium]|nr:2-oxoacid:acceptor oxidoreductase family protein [Deltaproteobacteria bacterium]
MDSLLNQDRPPVFCPGCAHERVVAALDQTFQDMGLRGEQIAIVSDIGCSGLFDTFFNTHAFHGLHGRALTYATGIKMARPDLHVVVTMGDGGLGIGGAHLLSTCRRNIDLTLLVLNNFNYGMTGGQCSSTTPQNAQVGSGFLNRLEKPMDVCRVAGAAGAAYTARASAYDKDLSENLATAIRYNGFALVDIWGVCPGRYTKRNKLSPKTIAATLDGLPPADHFGAENTREEYGRAYRQEAADLPPALPPQRIETRHTQVTEGRQEVVFLGSAGQRIVTAGELLCLAGASAGLQASQKNDYPITVLRGHSVSEVILSKKAIGYTGIQQPSVVVALAAEGVARRKNMLANLTEDALVIRAEGIEIISCRATVVTVDFKAAGIREPDWALAALATMAHRNTALSSAMLQTALDIRFSGKVYDLATTVVGKVNP